MNTTTSAITAPAAALAQIQGQPNSWATLNALPERSTVEYEIYEMTWGQLQAFQSQCSGSRIGATLEETLEWLLARSEDLHQDALGYDDYGLPCGYCLFGAFINQEGGELVAWYETTSGTVLAGIYPEEGDAKFHVFLPASRVGGYHHREIQYALAGATMAMRQRWHNAEMFLDDPQKRAAYEEHAEWFNASALVAEYGHEPMLKAESLRLEQKCLGVLRILDSLGYRMGAVVSTLGWNEAEQVEEMLSSALKKWRKIRQEEGWTTQSEDLEDYEGEYEGQD